MTRSADQITELQTELEEVRALLLDAPPRQIVTDERYWRWRTRVDNYFIKLSWRPIP